MSGIRNILLHLSDDLRNDQKSGAKNFVERIYPNPFFSAIRYTIVFEVLFSLAFFGTLASGHPAFLICMLVIFSVTGVAILLFREKGIEQLLNSKWKFFPNNIYEKWLPPVILITLSFIDIRFLIVLLFHFTFFNSDFFVQFLNHVLMPLRAAIQQAFFGVVRLMYFIRGVIHIVASFLVNYSIYYCFLLFGVDLKKENISAVDYLKKKERQNRSSD
jgi:hypothetical protein